MHCKSYSHFFSKKFQHICVSLDVNFNESLTNDIVSFEQLGPGNFKQVLFILKGDLFYVLPCVILFLCFTVLLALRLPRLGKRGLILVLFVRLFDLCLFGFVGFLFLLVSEGLRFVIVALPGLFFYLFFQIS